MSACTRSHDPAVTAEVVACRYRWPMADLAELKSLIEAALPGASAHLIDQGGGDHLAADVVAPQFADLSRIEQHRLVYAAVQARFDDGSIHALALRTRAPETT